MSIISGASFPHAAVLISQRLALTIERLLAHRVVERALLLLAKQPGKTLLEPLAFAFTPLPDRLVAIGLLAVAGAEPSSRTAADPKPGLAVATSKRRRDQPQRALLWVSFPLLRPRCVVSVKRRLPRRQLSLERGVTSPPRRRNGSVVGAHQHLRRNRQVLTRRVRASSDRWAVLLSTFTRSDRQPHC